MGVFPCSVDCDFSPSAGWCDMWAFVLVLVHLLIVSGPRVRVGSQTVRKSGGGCTASRESVPRFYSSSPVVLPLLALGWCGPPQLSDHLLRCRGARARRRMKAARVLPWFLCLCVISSLPVSCSALLFLLPLPACGFSQTVVSDFQIHCGAQSCPADLKIECGDPSGEWEGEFFPGIPKIKYEVRISTRILIQLIPPLRFPPAPMHLATRSKISDRASLIHLPASGPEEQKPAIIQMVRRGRRDPREEDEGLLPDYTWAEEISQFDLNIYVDSQCVVLWLRTGWGSVSRFGTPSVEQELILLGPRPRCGHGRTEPTHWPWPRGEVRKEEPYFCRAYLTGSRIMILISVLSWISEGQLWVHQQAGGWPLVLPWQGHCPRCQNPSCKLVNSLPTHFSSALLVLVVINNATLCVVKSKGWIFF